MVKGVDFLLGVISNRNDGNMVESMNLEIE